MPRTNRVWQKYTAKFFFKSAGELPLERLRTLVQSRPARDHRRASKAPAGAGRQFPHRGVSDRQWWTSSRRASPPRVAGICSRRSASTMSGCTPAQRSGSFSPTAWITPSRTARREAFAALTASSLPWAHAPTPPQGDGGSRLPAGARHRRGVESPRQRRHRHDRRTERG